MRELLEAKDESTALEILHSSGMTDGLPVIIPTPERVEAMLSFVDLDPDMLIGIMGPAGGAATLRHIAVSAVMAGCQPHNLPVLAAAIRAICREDFDLTEVVNTTHCLAPMFVVNGSASQDCGPICSGHGVLGPGDRHSASIGRAVSLALINIGGRKPGVSDMAVFANPAKYTAVLAEAEAASPFERFDVSRGADPDMSSVTAIAVEPPISFIVEFSGNAALDADRIVKNVAGLLKRPGSLHVYSGGKGGALVLLNPDHAQILDKAGLTRSAFSVEVAEQASQPRKDAEELYLDQMFPDTRDNAMLKALRDPEQLALVVAGGPGVYSALCPSWAFAPHGNLAVTETFDPFPSCAMPGGV